MNIWETVLQGYAIPKNNVQSGLVIEHLDKLESVLFESQFLTLTTHQADARHELIWA